MTDLDDFSFEDDTHTYLDAEGIAQPSVTQSLKFAGVVNYDHVDPFILERAKVRGKNVHRWTADFDRDGHADPMSLTLEEQVYARGWMAWQNDFRPTFLEIEKPMLRQIGKYKAGGTPDRIALISRRLWVVDIKCCASVVPGWELQLADYEMMYLQRSQIGALGRMAVRLKGKGKTPYSIKIYDDPRDAIVARAALDYTHDPNDFPAKMIVDTWKHNRGIAA